MDYSSLEAGAEKNGRGEARGQSLSKLGGAMHIQYVRKINSILDFGSWSVDNQNRCAVGK